MKFLSTRNKEVKVSGAEAIVTGLSHDGGLFVPESFPTVTKEELEAMEEMSYAERANLVIGKFLPEIEQSLPKMTASAYSRFEDEDPAPVVKIDDGIAVMELWHGPTHAFKDVALTLLPHLLVESKRVTGNGSRTLILVATSGDTGKAALEGFRDVEGTDVIVFYPDEGVSKLQKMQMQTQKGGNVLVCAIKGNFDDAQTAVKNIFTDEAVVSALKTKGFEFSSANSMNWGRLVPQIAYYFSAYVDLITGGEIEYGDEVNFVVPTGNFGNILAGYYAKRMGLPVGKLVCASNSNNVLTQFMETGEYDKNREFFKTSSPSMDILVSSNLERLLFELSGRSDSLTAKRMAELKEKGVYSLSEDELKALQSEFFAGFASEDEVADVLGYYFDEYGYIADTHTSVALKVYDDFIAETDDQNFTVVLSTASPYKFVDDVLRDIGEKPGKNELDSLSKLEDVTALPLPESLRELPTLPVLHSRVVDKTEAVKVVLDYVNDRSKK